MIEFFKKILHAITQTIKFIQNHFKATLFIFFLLWLLIPSSGENITPHNLEKITLNGGIFDVSDVVEKLEKAEKNERIKGVLFVMNSPGGAVAPSIELAHAIKRVAEKKPLIIYGSGMMASGGYYASIYAHKIIANPGSIIGSIGVIMQGADISELMDKIGIKTQSIQAGEYKSVGTADRAWSEKEKAELEKVIFDTYDMFVGDVANARGLDINSSSDYADAHIFTASQAMQVGLIDEIGVENDAKNLLIEMTGVENPIWSREDKIEKFMKKLAAESSSYLHTYFPSLFLR